MEDEVICFIFTVILIILISVINIFFEAEACRLKAEKQNLVYSYTVLEGCMVKKDGNWIDYDKFRMIGE